MDGSTYQILAEKKFFFFFFGLSENSGRAIQSDTTKSFATILPRYLAKKDRYKTRSLHLAKEKLLKKLHPCGLGWSLPQ